MQKSSLGNILVGMACAVLAHTTCVDVQAQTITTEAALRSAIISANSDGVDTTIYISGTINLTSMGSGEDQCASGDLDVTEVGKRLTIVGQGVATTKIQAYYWYSDRLFHVQSGAKLTIEDTYLKAEKSGGASVVGDGIFNAGGDLVLTRCTLYGTNLAPTAGSSGGIFNTGTATISDCLIQKNVGMASNGGGVLNTGTLTVTDTTFDSNGEQSYYGGGILNIAGTVDCTGCTFVDNYGTAGGGGIFTDGGSVDLYTCDFESNDAGGGGAIWNRNGDVYAYLCDFNENTGQTGGAIESSPQNGGTSTSVFETCNFTYNTSHAGGAFRVNSHPINGDTSIVNLKNGCIVEYNTASQDGGGVLAYGSLSLVNLFSTEVRYNNAGCLGGGVDNCGASVINGQLHDNSPTDYSNKCPGDDCE